MEPDRPQYDRPAAYVIAQQYSSTIFVLRFRSREENFGALSTEMLLFPFLLAFSKTVRSCSTLNCVRRTVFVSSHLFSKPVTYLVTSCSKANVELLSKEEALPSAPSQSRRHSIQVNPPPIKSQSLQLCNRFAPSNQIRLPKRAYCHLIQKSLG